jgi:two-component system, NarL family, response regulator LiaR
MSADRPIRVAVVDDYEVVVAGITALLSPYEDRLSVVEVDGDLRPAPGEVDIVLYDTFGHSRDHHDLDVQELSCGGTAKVVIFSWNLEPERVDRALRNGASGYVAKALPAEEIVAALERVHAGETVVPDSVRPAVVAGGGREDVVERLVESHHLSHREVDVIALIALGLTNEEIADRLYLSVNTVKSYIRTAYRKLHVDRRAQAVGWAMSHGLVGDVPRASDQHASAAR